MTNLGSHDWGRAADWADRYGAHIGHANLQHLSEATRARLRGLRVALCDGREALLQAADEIEAARAEAHTHAATGYTRDTSDALRRLFADIAALNEDKRHEHYEDDLRDAADDQEAS